MDTSRRPEPRSSARRGLTLVELLVVVFLIVVLLALVLPLASGRHRNSSQVRDATQLRQIHTAFLVWSRGLSGRFPTPAEIAQPKGGPDAARDVTLNTHANLYAASISHNYFSPQLCVSRAESNPKVTPCASYDYAKYAPSQGTFWDSAFRCDLDSVANLSYATMHLDGDRLTREWRESLNSRFAVLGNRGVRDGSTDPSVYGVSKTLAIHGPSSSWEGNIVYNDNHVAFETGFVPAGAPHVGPTQVPDNLFGDDSDGDGADIWLTMIKGVSREGSGAGRFDLSWD